MSAQSALSEPEGVVVGTAAQRPLGNNANNVRWPREVRAGRFDALNWLWGNSELHRVRDCCRFRVNDTVILEQGKHAGRLTGLSRCASIWACPVCSARIQAERSTDLADAIENHHDRGGHVAMLTLTMRHNASQGLRPLWEALALAWTAMASRNSAVARAKEAAGVMGFMRTVEATHGRHGWHLHIHALVFLEPGADLTALEDLDEAIASGWISALVNRGMPEPTRANGCELRLLEMGQARGEVSRYLAKASYLGERTASMNAASEVTQTQTKAAGYGNRTPWQILDDARAGDGRSRRLWAEWETVSRGRRCHTWSVGLRKALELDDELTDEELAQEDDDLDDFSAVPLLRFHRPAWDDWLVHHPKAHPKLLEAADTANDAAAIAVLLALPDRPAADSIDQFDHIANRWVPINLPNPPTNPDPEALPIWPVPPGPSSAAFLTTQFQGTQKVGGQESEGAKRPGGTGQIGAPGWGQGSIGNSLPTQTGASAPQPRSNPHRSDPKPNRSTGPRTG